MKSKCLETRQRNGMTWRRYRAPEGYFYTTYEVPSHIVKRFGIDRLGEDLQRAERKHKMLARQARVLDLHAAGTKVAAIADEVGLSESQVYRIYLAGKPGAKTCGIKRDRSKKTPTPPAASAASVFDLGAASA